MTSKAPSPLTKNIQLTNANIDLIKAEAAKSHRSAREWLNMYITATFPLPDTYVLEAAYKRATLGPIAHTPSDPQPNTVHITERTSTERTSTERTTPKPQQASNPETKSGTLYEDPILAIWESEADD